MSNICEQIHQLYNSLEKYNFPYNKTEIPKNGIYILFEKGEFAHGTNRIVRIGTHTGENNLLSRLNQHFIKEKKDRSIFRKNIGRAILHKENDDFLEQWNWDLTTKANKIKYLHQLNKIKQQEVESKVSKYIKSHFSFVVFEVSTKEQRLNLESKIISTVSSCNKCNPSENWLGNFSPINKISQSGLWLVQGLYKTPLNINDMKVLLK